MPFALSTAALKLIWDPEKLLASWQALASELPHVTLATDPRLPVDFQRTLVEDARRQGVTVDELVSPLIDPRGRRLPRLGAPERDERRAARQLLVALVTAAAEGEIPRVILHPEVMALHRDIPELQRRFARGEALQKMELDAEGVTLAPAVLDGWRLALDAALDRAAIEGIEIHILGPTLWPHQVPNAREVLDLQGEFSGAPLAWQLATDWRHARRVLWQSDDYMVDRRPPEEPLPPDILAMLPAEEIQRLMATEVTDVPTLTTGSVRVADACGLELRLPPGVGEVNWTDVDLGDAPRTLVCQGSADELERAARIVDAEKVEGW
ncbi:MAG: hypothetical protein KAI47_15320 [Deltaproteobacteria bacterium]|nr:hypothetical protein [Deltaproteobacteria bacterium]